MGISTVNQLIQRAKSMNEYNNSGVANDSVWIDFFNIALMSMVNDLKIEAETAITHSKTTKEQDLPTGFFSVLYVLDQDGEEVEPYYLDTFSIDSHPSLSAGYLIKNKGSKTVIEFRNLAEQTYTLAYIRYPEKLAASSQVPEVPTIGETALCYKAIGLALENNNQPGAQDFEDRYNLEVMKIQKAAWVRGG
ncbi:hypothetical protein CVD25_01100 [Bacillus canaveralius]|uniref:Uncharacterized protein n=1 Tax=Bacillus canaveralius TaxID=1403243 RepID=A0A2N5GPM8_9BACI|nr:hypothetical protein [Bacillus canaveralius]PLR84661.1 hypothetical protein CU635_06210 [Bacillus canaveralius]PLS00813.1 hypothetical protein CVD25_01100 [Bacillus canaveralius]